MAATSLSLNKTPHLYRFLGFSRSHISHVGQQIGAPANTAQISAFRGYFSCSWNSYPSNFGHGTAFKEVGSSKFGFVQLGFDRLCISAVADGGSGGETGGGFGGSGDGNSGDRGEGDSGGSDFDLSFFQWCWARLAYPMATKAMTSALLTSIRDIVCQLVNEQEPSLDLKMTSVLTLLGLAFLGPASRFWATAVFIIFDLCIAIATHCLEACICFFYIFCCIAIVVLAALAALAYAIAARQGLSEDDIGRLRQYRYRLASPLRASGNTEEQDVLGTGMEASNSHSTDEPDLQLEDSVCCICLSQYTEESKLYVLACNHHFHCGCISEWLRLKANCPVCRCEIRRGAL